MREPERTSLITACLMATVLAASACGGEGSRSDSVDTVASQSTPSANGGPGILDLSADTTVGVGTSEADLPAAAPDFEVQTLAGTPFTLEDRRGEVILINFWATWCPPCIVEIPDLNELYEEYRDAGLTILGVSVEDGEESVVREFVDEYQIRYPVAVSLELTEIFGGVYGLPTTYVIDRDGQIVHRVIGLFPVDDMLPTLRTLLGLANDQATG